MQHDEVIWQVIRHNHCSFMAKTTTGANLCMNKDNVTGLCNRSSCPLSNSRYATIRESNGVLYLRIKSIERAHNPNQLWEELKLPQNLLDAIQFIDKHMEYWPPLFVKYVKRRLLVMTQRRILMRKLALKTREKVITKPRKEVEKDARGEKKAETAANLDKSIERELLERVKSGMYGEESIREFEKMVIDRSDVEEEELETEYVEGYEDGLEEEEEFDMEDMGNFWGEDRRDREKSETKNSKKPRMMVEVEHEDDFGRQKRRQLV
ncbi:Protein mak16 [Linum perenne]